MEAFAASQQAQLAVVTLEKMWKETMVRKSNKQIGIEWGWTAHYS